MADSNLLEKLRATRSDYTEEITWHRFLLDAYTGGGGFMGRVKQPARAYLGWAAEVYSKWGNTQSSSQEADTYLDRFDREDLEKFNRRQAVAHYSNYTGPIADHLIAFISKHSPTREGLDDQVEDWLNDCDGKGTTWETFLSDTVRPRAALLGWTPILFDAPATDGEMTKAQADERKVRPRAIALLPANLLDWSADANGRFLWAKTRIDYQERETPFTAPISIQEYSVWYRDRVQRFRVRKEGDKEETVEAPTEVKHGFGEVPIVIWRHKPSPEEPVRGLSMVGDIAVANRRHFNLESELDEHLRSQVFGLLQIPCEDPAHPPTEVIGGNKNAMPIKADSRQPYAWIAPPESVAATLENRIAATIIEIYRMARVEYSQQTGAAESGISRAYKFEQTNSALRSFAQKLARSEEASFRIVSRGLGLSDDAVDQIKVTAPSDFRVEDLAADIDNTMKALGLDLPPTAERVLIARLLEKMLPNLPEEIATIIEDELKKAADERAAARVNPSDGEDEDGDGDEGGDNEGNEGEGEGDE